MLQELELLVFRFTPSQLRQKVSPSDCSKLGRQLQFHGIALHRSAPQCITNVRCGTKRGSTNKGGEGGGGGGAGREGEREESGGGGSAN